MSGNSTVLDLSSDDDACAFQPATLCLQIALSVAYATTLSMALLGNLVIIFLIFHYPKLKTTFNMLIVNMAASDVFASITAIPLSLAYLFQGVNWFQGGFAVFLCKFLPFLALISTGVSVLTLAWMAFDRYLAIVRTMRRPLSPRLTLAAIALTWTISAAMFVTELYKYRLFNESGQVICAPRWLEDLHESLKITKHEMVVRFFLLYLVPFLIMTILYLKLALHLRKRRAPGEQIDKNSQRIRELNRKVIFMLATIVTIFAICWLPAHVNHFLLTFDFKTYSCLPDWLILTSYFVTHANVAINPCLYFIFNENFRGAFRQQLRERFGRRRRNNGRRLLRTAPRTVSSSNTRFKARQSHFFTPREGGTRQSFISEDSRGPTPSASSTGFAKSKLACVAWRF